MKKGDRFEKMLPFERLTYQQFFDQHSSIQMFHDILWHPVSVHCHEFFEFSLILSGCGTHYLNGSEYKLAKGSIMLLTPADFHGLYVDNHNEPLILYNLIFSENIIDESIYHSLFAGIHNHNYQIHNDDLNILESCLQKMWQEYNERQFGSQIVLRGQLERVLIQLIRILEISPSILKGAKSGMANHFPLRKAMLYLQHHFRETIRLEDAARQAEMAPNYFSEQFRKQFGLTFQDYLADLRLNFARSLLQSSDLSVTEVCYASGFNTLSHFEKRFKRKFGVTPKQAKKV